MDALLSVQEAARRLGGISKWTIHAWLSQGRLQRTKVGGRTMIRESELTKVIEDGGKSPAPTRATLLESGLTIVQDGEGEGAAVFDPADVSQSKAAIRAAGVKRKRQLTPSQREQRSAFLQAAQGRHLRSCGPLG